MTMVQSTTCVAAVRTVRMPRGAAATAIPRATALAPLADGQRHRTIGSLPALALAAAGALLVTGLMWAAL